MCSDVELHVGCIQMYSLVGRDCDSGREDGSNNISGGRN
jgi:hypothetical protein